MNTPGALEGYTALIPPETAWPNRVPARSLLTFAFYRPVRFAPQVTCPTLVIAGEQAAFLRQPALYSMTTVTPTSAQS